MSGPGLWLTLLALSVGCANSPLVVSAGRWPVVPVDGPQPGRRGADAKPGTRPSVVFSWIFPAAQPFVLDRRKAVLAHLGVSVDLGHPVHDRRLLVGPVGRSAMGRLDCRPLRSSMREFGSTVRGTMSEVPFMCGLIWSTNAALAAARSRSWRRDGSSRRAGGGALGRHVARPTRGHPASGRIRPASGLT